MIGSGEGTLSISDVVREYLEGIADAADEVAAGGENVFAPARREADHRRARPWTSRGHPRGIRGGADDGRGGHQSAEQSSSSSHAKAEAGAGGRVSVEDGLALLADSARGRRRAGGRLARGRSALATLLACAGASQTVRKPRARVPGGRARRAARVGQAPLPRRAQDARAAPKAKIPARISFWHDGLEIRAAAIDQSATVARAPGARVSSDVDRRPHRQDDRPRSERGGGALRAPVRPTRSDASSATPCAPGRSSSRSTAARPSCTGRCSPTRDGGESVPLSVRKPFARQLRTTYSPAPTRPQAAGGRVPRARHRRPRRSRRRARTCPVRGARR